MRRIEPVDSFEKIKLLADPRRLEILRLLMAAPATLTQLGQTLKQSPARVRHHILALESGGLVKVSEVRRTGRVTEKFYRAWADGLLLQEIVLPKMQGPIVIFSGSHDLALEGIAVHLAPHVTLLNMPVGSLDGLVHLRQGLCELSGSHLLDEDGEYNAPTIRRLFPDRDVELITLAHRTQGLMLPRGNPKGVRTMSDLSNAGVRFVNRNPGSGTRLWLDRELGRIRIAPQQINGYDRSVNTHSDAAAMIAARQADAAVGLFAAARREMLDFVPLFEERYDLVLLRENEKRLAPLLDYLQTSHFRSELASLAGYDATHSGERVEL